jgi:hypothetical protein
MKPAFQILLLLALTSAAVAAQKDSSLPPWRAPTDAELGSPEEQQWRHDDPARYLVMSGDFDGDGKPDQARLMVRNDGKAFALFVKLAARDTAQKLDEFPDMWMLPSIGIKRVAPATYPTACARGFDCAEDEPKYIRVTHEAIDFFKTESAETYYYWNETRHAFARAGITD